MNTERTLLAAAIDNRQAANAIIENVDSKDLTEPGRLVLETIERAARWPEGGRPRRADTLTS